MTRRAFQAAFFALLAGGAFAHAEELAKEAQSLDGTWKVTALTSGDKEAPEDVFRTWRWEIKGKKIVISAEGEEPVKTAAVIDPSKSPATIDMTALSGPTKGQAAKGIFELKQEKLRVCLGSPGFDSVRLTEFIGSAGRGLITLERIKKP